MDNPVLVDHPMHWPNRCIACNGQKGPLVDTGNEYIDDHRLYLCKQCVKTLAMTFGFVKGEKMEQLSRAVDELAARDQQIADQTGQIDKLTVQVAEARRRAEALDTLLQQARDKERTQVTLIDQIHEPLRQLAGTVQA